ncbi:OmpA family protein [Glaciimonas soli]|uniref:OmpA family protein n=1 Tax=Glaciimonas soli TaxID=2590999 RepID=A0A843YNG1_9BURK|nr:OmpA family protein [Glaciimonas soli]MQR01389.1 OmpA family protein [Glaciimonas soli]
MVRSKKWWWGLPLLFLLWLIANWTKTTDVEQDLKSRAGSASGDSTLTVAGRDVTLSNATQQAHDAADQTHGVRLVNGTINDQAATAAATGSSADIAAAAVVATTAAATAMTATSANTGDTDAAATGIVDAKACEQLFATALSQSKVLFNTAQATLSPASQATVKELVDIAKRCPDDAIEVDGYTDNTGKSALNVTLSKHRAETVVAYMKQAGITPDHLKAAGFGDANPIASNDTDDGKAQNRRIEMHVTDNASGTPATSTSNAQ